MGSIQEINLDGFKVVSSEYFCNYSRLSVPTLTIWNSSIGFTKQDLLLLNACENVVMQVHSTDKKILIVPTTSKDPDAIKWVKKTDPLEARKIGCAKLAEKLYQMWGWDKNMVYRTSGRLVTAGNKVMLYFDFTEPESWRSPEAKNAP